LIWFFSPPEGITLGNPSSSANQLRQVPGKSGRLFWMNEQKKLVFSGCANLILLIPTLPAADTVGIVFIVSRTRPAKQGNDAMQRNFYTMLHYHPPACYCSWHFPNNFCNIPKFTLHIPFMNFCFVGLFVQTTIKYRRLRKKPARIAVQTIG
jgi:hypothetical protein